MGAIRNPEAGLMEALRTLRAVPGVIAPVRLSLILLACGGTRYNTVYHRGFRVLEKGFPIYSLGEGLRPSAEERDRKSVV